MTTSDLTYSVHFSDNPFIFYPYIDREESGFDFRVLFSNVEAFFGNNVATIVIRLTVFARSVLLLSLCI
jgi:hypothetical protein